MRETTWTAQPAPVEGRRQMNAARQEAVGGASVSGWSQQPVIVDDRNVTTAVHSELMQKSSVTEQQQSMSGRQNVNTAATAGLLTVNTGASNAGTGRSVSDVTTSSLSPRLCQCLN